jgi:hypothetical protein
MRLTIFLLLFSLSAQGQMVIDSYRFGAPAADLLLDSFSGAHSAYSLRKLDKDYAGDAIVVRRANNDTLSIGFSGNYLDTTAMKTFCGTGGSDSCTVRRWFDQSGNDRNVSQTTTANQPTIMRAGAIVYIGGSVAIDFDGTNDVLTAATATDWNFLHQTGIYFNFGVSKAGNVADPNSSYAVWGTRIAGDINGAFLTFDDRVSESINNALRHIAHRSGGPVVVLVNTANNAVSANTRFLHTVYGDLGNATAAEKSGIGVNNGAYVKNNATGGTIGTGNATNALSFGAAANATGVLSIFLRGQIFEQVFYASDQSANRTAINTNINNFYSIY